MDLAEYRRRYGNLDVATPGWDALNASLEELYGDQEPKHWGTIVRYTMGGKDPIDGISAYECRGGSMAARGLPAVDHLHFCTFGYTSLYYDEKSAGGEENGFGFEMTFRLASELPPDEQPMWVCSLFQNLARYVFETGNYFGNGHWIPSNGPIKAESDTQIVGLVFVLDPALPPTTSPHGTVQFVQGFGITQKEVDALMSKSCRPLDIVERHRKSNPLLVTDLSRRD